MAEHKMSFDIIDFGPTLGNSISNVGYLYNVTDIPQGNASFERIGDKITTSSLQIVMTCAPSTVATIEGVLFYRLLVFIWKDDTTPVLTDIFEDINYPWLSPLRYDNKVKRKIIFDKLYSSYVEAQNPTSTWNTVKIQRININLSKMKRKNNVVNYVPASADAVNHMYWVLISNTTANANSWLYTVSTRLTYIDM